MEEGTLTTTTKTRGQTKTTSYTCLFTDGSWGLMIATSPKEIIEKKSYGIVLLFSGERCNLHSKDDGANGEDLNNIENLLITGSVCDIEASGLFRLNGVVYLGKFNHTFFAFRNNGVLGWANKKIVKFCRIKTNWK